MYNETEGNLKKTMFPLTSAPNCFVDEENVMRPILRRGARGSRVKTGFRARIGSRQFERVTVRTEDVDFDTAEAAEKRINDILPGVKTEIVGPEGVLFERQPAIGNVHTNFFVRLGDRVDLAPLWILLNNGVADPSKVGPTAGDIEFVVSQRAPGIWGEILDARG